MYSATSAENIQLTLHCNLHITFFVKGVTATLHRTQTISPRSPHNDFNASWSSIVLPRSASISVFIFLQQCLKDCSRISQDYSKSSSRCISKLPPRSLHQDVKILFKGCSNGLIQLVSKYTKISLQRKSLQVPKIILQSALNPNPSLLLANSKTFKMSTKCCFKILSRVALMTTISAPRLLQGQLNKVSSINLQDTSLELLHGTHQTMLQFYYNNYSKVYSILHQELSSTVTLLKRSPRSFN